ncbi:MAG: hypothetical protein GF365_03840 [Candidatus Buchananbacteria bacterium]|nr:hypothetical protein [Candidatus Buchananbacteria bacterium]
MNISKSIESFKKWLKRKTGVDFSNWVIFVFFIFGIISLFYHYRNFKLDNFINTIILWITAIVILKYTKETYDLKKLSNKQLTESRKQTFLSLRPFIRLHWIERSEQIRIINEGHGIAIDVEVKFNHDNNGIIRRSIICGERASKFYTDADFTEIENTRESIGDINTFKAKYSPDIITYSIDVKYKDITGNIYNQKFVADKNLNDKYRLLEWDIPKNFKKIEMDKVRL